MYLNATHTAITREWSALEIFNDSALYKCSLNNNNNNNGKWLCKKPRLFRFKENPTLRFFGFYFICCAVQF